MLYYVVSNLWAGTFTSISCSIWGWNVTGTNNEHIYTETKLEAKRGLICRIGRGTFHVQAVIRKHFIKPGTAEIINPQIACTCVLYSTGEVKAMMDGWLHECCLHKQQVKKKMLTSDLKCLRLHIPDIYREMFHIFRISSFNISNSYCISPQMVLQIGWENRYYFNRHK